MNKRRFNFYLDATILKDIRKRLIDQEQSMSSLVRNLLREWLEGQE